MRADRIERIRFSMSEMKGNNEALDKIKQRLNELEPGQVKTDLAWLVERVEKLSGENEKLRQDNEFLKNELYYGEASCPR